MSENDRFLRNVAEARSCGYDLVCAACGCGMNDEDFEDATMHDTGCPNAGRDRTAELAEFIAKRLNHGRSAESISQIAREEP